MEGKYHKIFFVEVYNSMISFLSERMLRKGLLEHISLCLAFYENVFHVGKNLIFSPTMDEGCRHVHFSSTRAPFQILLYCHG
jgi:hypothetical protein